MIKKQEDKIKNVEESFEDIGKNKSDDDDDDEIQVKVVHEKSLDIYKSVDDSLT